MPPPGAFRYAGLSRGLAGNRQGSLTTVNCTRPLQIPARRGCGELPL